MGEAESLPRRLFTMETSSVTLCQQHQAQVDCDHFLHAKLPECSDYVTVQLPVHFQATLSRRCLSARRRAVLVSWMGVSPSRDGPVWNMLYIFRGIFGKEERRGAVVEDGQLFHIFAGVGGGLNKF